MHLLGQLILTLVVCPSVNAMLGPHNIVECFYELTADLTVTDRTGQAGVTSQTVCSARCDQQILCHAWEWDSSDTPTDGMRCWLAFLPVFYGAEVDNYIREELCNPQGGACSTIFSVTLDYHMTDGIALEGLETPEACAVGCAALDECFAFDFDRSANPWEDKRCWALKYMDNYFTTTAGTQINHYSKSYCTEPISTTPPPTSTQPTTTVVSSTVITSTILSTLASTTVLTTTPPQTSTSLPSTTLLSTTLPSTTALSTSLHPTTSVSTTLPSTTSLSTSLAPTTSLSTTLLPTTSLSTSNTPTFSTSAKVTSPGVTDLLPSTTTDFLSTQPNTNSTEFATSYLCRDGGTCAAFFVTILVFSFILVFFICRCTGTMHGCKSRSSFSQGAVSPHSPKEP